MPLAVFVAGAENGTLAGFIEVDLRSHPDGCSPAVPVGCVEGWYVGAKHRRRGFGAQLMAAADNWARAHGSIEMASDAWLSSDVSQTAHEALGFEVVDRYRAVPQEPVNRTPCAPPSLPAPKTDSFSTV